MSEKDAEDLLECYNDPICQKLQNADNCNGGDFNSSIIALDRMKKAIDNTILFNPSSCLILNCV